MPLTNNDIIKKLRVALSLRDDDIIEILGLVDFKISKSELGAFFRKEEHPNYMELQDQILRNFLNGLVIYKRGPMEKKEPMKQDQHAAAEWATGQRSESPQKNAKRIAHNKRKPE